MEPFGGMSRHCDRKQADTMTERKVVHEQMHVCHTRLAGEAEDGVMKHQGAQRSNCYSIVDDTNTTAYQKLYSYTHNLNTDTRGILYVQELFVDIVKGVL